MTGCITISRSLSRTGSGTGSIVVSGRNGWPLRFNGVDADININTAEPEFGAWKWVVPNELIDMAVPFKRDVYRDVMKSFGTLLDS